MINSTFEQFVILVTNFFLYKLLCANFVFWNWHDMRRMFARNEWHAEVVSFVESIYIRMCMFFLSLHLQKDISCIVACPFLISLLCLPIVILSDLARLLNVSRRYHWE